MRKTSKVMFSLLATSILGLSACNKGPEVPDDPKEPTMGVHTYMTYTTTSPSNWNMLTYKDNNDTQIMDYLGGSFFTFNYQFDEDGDVVEGGYSIEADGAVALEDITSQYVDYSDYGGPKPEFKTSIPATQDDDGDGVPDRFTGDGDGYAYKITLRQDLKWDDGTPIKAADFVYSMKEQLNPLFLNYRADSYYVGSMIIHNAKEYVKQGQEGIFAADTAFPTYDASKEGDVIFASYTDSTRVENAHVVDWFIKNNPSYAKYFAKTMTNAEGETVDGYGIFLIPYLYNGPASGVASVAKAAEYSKAMDGKTLTEIRADETLSGYLDILHGWWATDPTKNDEMFSYFVANFAYPALDFNKVGLFVGDNDYEIIMVLDKSLDLLNEDGSLGYKAAYNLGVLPLVKEDLYERCKVEPATPGALWTSKYHSSAETSASWGPYKLTSFQAGKQYILERNDQWYGYGMKEYKGQYQTDRIVCNTIAEWQTAWLSFQKGNLTSIGIDVSISEDYKNSSRATFRASDFISSLQLQSDKEALTGRETAGVDKEMLNYVKFRKALSLSIDRSDYAKKTTTAYQAGLGIFNSMHYFAVEKGAEGVYRDTDAAKVTLCNVYGVNIDDFNTLDDAVASIGNGQNLVLARQLLNEAYDEALAAGTISASDKVVLTIGADEDNEANRRMYNYLKEAFEKLAEGTKLAGRLTCDFDGSFGDKWADDFRDGAYDICTGGWSGAAWDPGYFLLAYLDDNYRYAQGWDPTSVTLEYNPYDDGDEDHIYEMNLMEWYKCLNGASDAPGGINWSEGKVSAEFRVGIIAKLEQAILESYYVCPMMNGYGASLLSYKVENFQKTYNTFMGFGGIRYMTYRYDDLAWAHIKTYFDYKN